MTNEELVNLATPILKKIDAVVGVGKINAAYRLFNSPQPLIWIESEKSDLLGGTYDYNRIGLIECLVETIFFESRFIIVSNYILNEKGKFSSTTICDFQHRFNGEDVRHLSGIATVYANSIKELTLSVPLSFSNSKKHAARQLGDLFGKSLNRVMEDSPQLPVIQVDRKVEPDAEYDKIISGIKECKWRNDALKIIEDSGPYKMGLKHNADIIKIVNEKPLLTAAN